MKQIAYGMDVIAYIGHLRFKEHKTRTKIASILKDKKVNISDRQVQKLYERYALLLRANVEAIVKDDLQKVDYENGGIILSIDDGVQPEIVAFPTSLFTTILCSDFSLSITLPYPFQTLYKGYHYGGDDETSLGHVIDFHPKPAL